MGTLGPQAQMETFIHAWLSHVPQGLEEEKKKAGNITESPT